MKKYVHEKSLQAIIYFLQLYYLNDIKLFKIKATNPIFLLIKIYISVCT